MITEIILIIFVITYYLFSVAMFGAYIQDLENMNFVDTFGRLIVTILFSPIATPVILGIELGEWIKNH